ncbi:MAG: hypothetical protein WAM60_18605 [Candidatus Promineifilaceae bacterium]
MMKAKHFLILILTAFLAACSIDISDNPTPTPPAIGDNTGVESPTTASQPTTQEGTTPEAAGPTTEETSPTEASATLPPPAWAEMGLTGSFYYNAFINEQQNLLRLDLETGEQVTLYDPPENAWLADVAVSPNGRQIAMAYGPPPDEGQVQFGFTDLYTMPADGSAEPVPLLTRKETSETFYNVSWPLDDYLYYAHFVPTTDDLGSVVYYSQVERFHIPSGESEVLVERAAWPRLSEDGTKMAYVTDNNDFVVSNADGSNPLVIDLSTNRFPAVDAPLFSPDGNTLYFSAIEPEVQPLLSFWDRLMGVKVASAHSVPSDWWRISADGSGEPEQLTNIFEIGMYGDFGPDGNYIGFITASGVQVMNPDGTGVVRLKNIPTTGTMNWVP